MKKNIVVLCTIFITHFLNSQTTIAPSGGNASGNGGTSSYTIGQLFYTSNSHNSGSINQGEI